jgi:hypothetical protein
MLQLSKQKIPRFINEGSLEFRDQLGVNRRPRQQSDMTSLSQAAEQFGVLIDEFVDHREKWR